MINICFNIIYYNNREENNMFCPNCKEPMEDVKRKGGFHGKTKFICETCNLKRFVENKKGNRNKGNKKGKGRRDD